MTVLTPANAFPGANFPGSTNTENYLYPGAVQPQSTKPTVLGYANAFPNAKFPGNANSQSFLFPGAAQPQITVGGFTAKFRKSLSPIGGRVGSRQGWAA